jgi:hypothetical protein
MGKVFNIYNLAATLAIRRFAATYRRHIVMLGIFVFMILSSLTLLVRMALVPGDAEGPTDISESVTPGALAITTFVLLLIRGLADVQRTVLKDRALWSTLVAPMGEGRVRLGLLLRTLVFQMGVLALVLGTFVLVLLVTPDRPSLPWETGPLIVLAGLAAGVMPLPLLLSALNLRRRSHLAVLAVLLTLDGAFTLALELEMAIEVMFGTGIVLIVGTVAITLAGPPSIATTWSDVDGQRFRPSRSRRGLPPAFSVLVPRLDPVRSALFRREMVLGYPRQQRLAFAGLNVALAIGLVMVNLELRDLMVEEGFGGYYHYVITPFMVGLGIFAVCFFQATMPMVDGVTREGPAIWVLRSSPVEPKHFIAAKVRPLLAFLPLTAVATGFALPFMADRGWEAMAIGMLGASAVYLAFLGIGAWAGAHYPNLDRHSNAPPDLVLAFYLMFGCLVLEGIILGPVLAIGTFAPDIGVVAAAFAAVVGWLIMYAGIHLGGRKLGMLEVA